MTCGLPFAKSMLNNIIFLVEFLSVKFPGEIPRFAINPDILIVKVHYIYIILALKH